MGLTYFKERLEEPHRTAGIARRVACAFGKTTSVAEMGPNPRVAQGVAEVSSIHFVAGQRARHPRLPITNVMSK